MRQFNYSAFQDMDYIFTSAIIHPLSGIIRFTEDGWRGLFNPSKCPSHEGIMIGLGSGGVKVWHILEMAPSNDGQKGDLKLHPLSMYLTNGLWSPSVMAVKRSNVYNVDISLRMRAVQYCLDTWQEGKTKYDYSGCARWNEMFKWMKDKPKDYYCSEFREHIDQTVANFSTVGLLGKRDDATPDMHYKTRLTFDVPAYK
jgi:hypothetical protein